MAQSAPKRQRVRATPSSTKGKVVRIPRLQKNPPLKSVEYVDTYDEAAAAWGYTAEPTEEEIADLDALFDSKIGEIARELPPPKTERVHYDLSALVSRSPVDGLSSLDKRIYPLIRHHMYIDQLVHAMQYQKRAFGSEEALHGYLKCYAGIDFDRWQNGYDRSISNTWNCKFVLTNEQDDDPPDTEIDDGPGQDSAENDPVHQLLQADPKDIESFNAIIEDYSLIAVKIDPSSYCILDWHLHFG